MKGIDGACACLVGGLVFDKDGAFDKMWCCLAGDGVVGKRWSRWQEMELLARDGAAGRRRAVGKSCKRCESAGENATPTPVTTARSLSNASMGYNVCLADVRHLA